MTKTISQTRLNNRAAKREAEANTRAVKIMTQAFTKVYCADDAEDVVVDSKGRRIRMTPASDAEIRAFLVGNRVVDTIELWETIGQQATANLIANGSIRRGKDFNRYSVSNFYWVTEKARELYSLPAQIMTPGGPARYASVEG